MADIAGMGDGKKREVEVKHLYALNMQPYVKPLVERIQELDTVVQQNDAAIHGAVTGALRVFFARLEDVRAKSGAVDLDRLMGLINSKAAEQDQFVL